VLDFLKGLFTAMAAAAVIRLGAEVLFEQAGLYMYGRRRGIIRAV